MNRKTKYNYFENPATRNAIIDLLNTGSKSHYTPVFLEVDITDSLLLLKNRKRVPGNNISFLSWVLKCISTAVERHKKVQAMFHKKGIVVFDDVDIALVIERKNPDQNSFYDRLMMPYIIRDVNNKSIPEIFEEIIKAQNEQIVEGDVNLGDVKNTKESKLFVKLPKYLRNFIYWNKLKRNAFLSKKTLGTVLVSPVNMILNRSEYFWGISRSVQPLSILITSMVKKPAVYNDEVVPRDFLCMTIGFHHDVIDGAPFARFVETLRKLMQSSHGLKD